MTTSLIDKLRRRISDDRPNYKAMSVAVSAPDVTRAILDVTDGRLAVAVAGGTAPSIDFDLSSVLYNTIDKLYLQLTRLEGYTVQLDEDASGDHLSIDLFGVPPTDIGGQSATAELKHFLFSDTELDEVLREAVQRHNPSFTVNTLPPTEEIFVFQLSHAEVCRRQAYDSSKRKGLSETVSDLLQIATNLEVTYTSDVTRLARSIESPKEAASNTTNEGDIMLGVAYRKSMRTGFASPISQNIAPKPVVLLEPDDVRDVEDGNIRVRWQRTRDQDFYSQELWLDTVAGVTRSQNGLTFAGQPFAGTPVIDSGVFRGVIRKTTSTLVFRSWGANTNFDTATFHTFIEEFGQELVRYNVGDLEPETEYFFRLYVQDLNYETTASNVVRYKTKPLRVRFDETTPMTPVTGPTGTVVTLFFDSTKGVFTTEHTVRFESVDVTASVVIIGPYEITVVIPTYTVFRIAKNVVVTSPTGLYDVLTRAFTVTDT